MPKILIEIDTDTQAVVPMDLMRRIEDYLSTERVSAGVSLYNDVLGVMMAAAPHPEQAQIKETGPWTTGSDNGRCFVESGDFTHDVRLYIDGDFSDFGQKCAYAAAIAKRLNAQQPEQAQQSDIEFPSPYALIEIDVDHGVSVVEMPSHKTVEVFSRKQVMSMLAAQQPTARPIPTSERDEFMRGAMVAISCLVRCHGPSQYAADTVIQLGFSGFDLSNLGLEEFDLEPLRELNEYNALGLVIPAEPGGE